MTRIRVVHRSGYDYDPWAMASHNEARMAPKSTPGQFVLSHKIEITPTAWQHAYTDYWGTSVLAFEVHEKHPRLSIVATSEVDVTRSALAEAAHEPLEWSALDDPALRDDLCEYLEATHETDVAEVLDADLREVRAASARPVDFAHAMQRRISEHLQWAPRPATSPHTASDSWRLGAGTRRDSTHLLAGALRSQGIPTRYVLGYALTEESPEIGVPVRGGSHSWVEFWDGRWAALDPITGQTPGDFHIEVGHGRDHHDVNPLSGIFTGVRTADTFVEVLLTRLG